MPPLLLEMKVSGYGVAVSPVGILLGCHVVRLSHCLSDVGCGVVCAVPKLACGAASQPAALGRYSTSQPGMWVGRLVGRWVGGGGKAKAKGKAKL